MYYSVFKGAEPLILQRLLRYKRPIIYVSHDEAGLEILAQNLAIILPDIKILVIPGWDCLPYDRVSPSAMIMSKRLEAFAFLADREQRDSDLIIITSTTGLLQKVVPLRVIASSNIYLKQGQEITQRSLIELLYTIGFTRSPVASTMGEFALRGGIMDIVTYNGYRLNFSDNIIDNIRLYDVQSQLSSSYIDDFTITASSEVIVREEYIANFEHNYRKIFANIDTALYKSISQGMHYIGMEHWLPLFYNELSTIIDFLPKDVLFVTDHLFDQSLKQRVTAINDYYQARYDFSSSYNPIEPQMLYLSEFTLPSDNIVLTPEVAESGYQDNFIRTEKLNHLAQHQQQNVVDILSQYIAKTTANNKLQRIFICCATDGSRQRIMQLFEVHEITAVSIDNWQDRNKANGSIIGLMIYHLEHGFIDNNHTYFSECDLLGERLHRVSRRKSRPSNFLRDIDNLELSDLVTHIDYGIGKFMGVETLQTAGIKHDFIKLLYADNDKLYIPVENIDLISKYGESEIELDRLGSSIWHNKKKQLKKKIAIAAEQLLYNTALRKTVDGIIMQPIEHLYGKFCQHFPYVETEDQANAIKDVEQDLCSGQVMDRLICGDVGFGKTEVALRASCIAVANHDNPSQVAVIVPTTLLARQHYREFKHRFAHLPVRVAQLSRLVSIKERVANKQDLAAGRVDIIIGTHALLAKGVKFHNLGLVIIDEEQKFGVSQKEKLKSIRKNLHFLTLTATPIPRTLHMSLNGIKDMSLITTPPIDRMPIKTQVFPYDRLIIRDAILREYYRGGRVFYISPRISYLQELYQELKLLVPEVKIMIAHGGMKAGDLDKIMNDFYDGYFNVLLSTTIIESGLDIPMANTMIIDRSDMFGLSQLYQIRGRIGRSKVKAYAYLTYHQENILSKVNQRNLQIMASMDTLGNSGFSIATHDMDIRGYGNIVGGEQSGHIKQIGLCLYQRMLQDAMNELKGEEVQGEWSPLLNLGVSVQIPNDYIADEQLRLSLYRRIASLENEDQVELFASEMIDRFGSLPDSVRHLVSIIKIKQLAKAKNIAKVDCGGRAIVISFKGVISDNALQSIVSKNNMKLRPDGKLLVLCSYESQDKLLIGVEKILYNL